MNLLRCFLAIELPASLQDAIAASTAEARMQLGVDLVRWVPTRNIHLTLKFLGETAPTGIPLIESALNAEVPQFKPFAVIAEGFGAFPNSRRPRVLWVGLTAPPALNSLQHELDVATARLGYVAEERTYSPHLTIGRVRQSVTTGDVQRIREEVERTTIGKLGSLWVDAVHLFKSDLDANGSVYTRLHTAHLARA